MTFSVNNINNSASQCFTLAQELFLKKDTTGSCLRAAAAVIGGVALGIVLQVTLPYLILPFCGVVGIFTAIKMIRNPENINLPMTVVSAAVSVATAPYFFITALFNSEEQQP